jgi:hypothetical protein
MFNHIGRDPTGTPVIVRGPLGGRVVAHMQPPDRRSVRLLTEKWQPYRAKREQAIRIGLQQTQPGLGRYRFQVSDSSSSRDLPPDLEASAQNS